MPLHHPLRTNSEHGVVPRNVAPTAPPWPSYTGTAQFVGTSQDGRTTVYVDPTLGQPALQNAQDLVADATRIASANDGIFGSTGGNVSVIVFALGGATDGTGGADHMGCDYVNGAAIEVCASFGNSARVSALFEAELSECSMGGNLCGVSTGEALSRWCAAVVGNNALSDFATAPTWSADGMPNYLDRTDATDQNADSTGCGMAFISWMLSQNYTLAQIAQATAANGDTGTFAQLYANLTSDAAANAWPNFSAAINGLAAGITNDDPFGTGLPAHLSRIEPWAAELSGRIFASILADISAGKTEHQIVAGVRAILASRPSHASPSHCTISSRRLLPPTKRPRGT